MVTSPLDGFFNRKKLCVYKKKKKKQKNKKKYEGILTRDKMKVRQTQKWKIFTGRSNFSCTPLITYS